MESGISRMALKREYPDDNSPGPLPSRLLKQQNQWLLLALVGLPLMPSVRSMSSEHGSVSLETPTYV